MVANVRSLKKRSSPVPILLGHEDASRQDAERTFDDAHIPIENRGGNAAVLEQNLDKGEQDGIVCLHELAHTPILALRCPCGNVALRPAAAKSL
jgi:hypothetical protein